MWFSCLLDHKDTCWQEIKSEGIYKRYDKASGTQEDTEDQNKVRQQSTEDIYREYIETWLQGKGGFV